MTQAYSLSKSSKWLCRFMQGFAILTAFFLVYVGYADGFPDKIIGNYWDDLTDAQQAVVTYTPIKKAILQTIATISWLSPLLILLGIFRVFGAFATSEPLSLKSVRAIRFLGLMMVIRAIASIATQPAMMVALTYDNPPGMSVVAVGISTYQSMNLLLGVVFLLAGQFFTMAVAATEENKQFI